MNAFQARTLSIITKLESKKEYEEMVPVYTRSALEDINKRIEYSASIGQSELKVVTTDYPNLNKEAFKCIKAERNREKVTEILGVSEVYLNQLAYKAIEEYVSKVVTLEIKELKGEI